MYSQLISQGLHGEGALCTLVEKDVTVHMVMANNCYGGFQEWDLATVDWNIRLIDW